jgi:trimeric autotransporter adhesin
MHTFLRRLAAAAARFLFVPLIAAVGSVAAQCTPQWSALGGGAGSSVFALTFLPSGDLVAGGLFTTAGGIAASNIARWNGSAWSAIGSGMTLGLGSSDVQALALLPNGELVASGRFTMAGGTVATFIARWSGSAWSALGSGTTGEVSALAVLPNGDLVAAGNFTTAGGGAASNIARWNGSTWSALGGGTSGVLRALAVLPNGDLIAGGRFGSAGTSFASNIARWDGASWSALGSGLGATVGSGQALSLVVLPNGDLVVGGIFTAAGGVAVNNIARWRGGSWSALGSGINGQVVALAVLPNGDLVAGGAFTAAGGVAANNIARWNGSAWSALGSGTGGVSGRVRTLAVGPNGDLVAAGDFTTAGGQPAVRVARYATPCQAVVAAVGAACASSGGANAYSAMSLPWTGSTYRTRGTGLPSFAFVAVVNGFSATSIPLAAVLPPSPGGCTLLASPDVVDAVLTTTGTVDAQLVLPNTPSLAGVVLHQQLVALEVDANLNFLQNTSTNALVATIGVF